MSPVTVAILDLPAELIADVFRHLDNTSFFQARTTCGFLERASSNIFGRRFFRKKGFLVTTPALNALDCIANHPALSKHVQHIWFNPDLFTFLDEACLAPNASSVHTSCVDLQSCQLCFQQIQCRQAYLDCVGDHEFLLYSRGLEHSLISILPKLINLEVIGMRRSTSYSPYDCTRIRTAVGLDPRLLGPIPTGPAKRLSGSTMLYSAFMGALKATGITLKRLYTDAVETDEVRSDLRCLDGLKYICSEVEWLEINVAKARLDTKVARSEQGVTEAVGSGLVSLLQACRRLRGLDLVIFPARDRDTDMPSVHGQLNAFGLNYQHVVFERVSQNVEFKQLQRLKLEGLATSATALIDFMRPCAASLRSLKFRGVYLTPPPEYDISPWKIFFDFLVRCCLDLDYVFLHNLKHRTGGITFVGQDVHDVDITEGSFTSTVPNDVGPFDRETFTEFDSITLEEQGSRDVRRRLTEVAEKHRPIGPVFSYAMDDDMWHTDTSDDGD